MGWHIELRRLRYASVAAHHGNEARPKHFALSGQRRAAREVLFEPAPAYECARYLE